LKVEFKNRHLRKLYKEGKAAKYKIPDNVRHKFFMRIQQLEAAATIHDLWKTVSINFEALKGCDNRYSVRLDRKWRLEMAIEWEDAHQTKGVISILELSKHYED